MPSLQPLLAWVSPPSPAHRAMKTQGGRPWSYRALGPQLGSSAPLPCRESLSQCGCRRTSKRRLSREGSLSPDPCPTQHSPAIPVSRIESAKPPTAASQWLENQAPQPLGKWAAAWLYQPSRLPEKVSQKPRQGPSAPNTSRAPAPRFLSVPKRQQSEDPQWACRLHRCPTNSPGSLTPAGPPRATHPALLGPRSCRPTLSTSLTLTTQKLPGLSGLICKMGQAPSPPQGTPRKTLAAQRAFHWEGPRQLPGAQTSSVAEARERQNAGSHGPFRSPPRRMGGAPAWGIPGQARLGGLVLLCIPSLHPATVGPAWAGALVPSTYQTPSGEAWGGGELTGPWGPRRPASWWILL